MSGINPYMSAPEIVLPKKSYKITFFPLDITIEADPQKFGTASEGLMGSILSIAYAHDIDIDHSCGGVCACSTCHIIVRQGLGNCNEPSEDEEDMLDLAPGLQPQSRLACQCVPNGMEDIVVEIPEWNRNAVKETH